MLKQIVIKIELRFLNSFFFKNWSEVKNPYHLREQKKNLHILKFLSFLNLICSNRVLVQYELKFN